jgi:hypothetical protein
MALTDKQAKALGPNDKPVFDGKVTGLLPPPGMTGSKWALRFTSPVTGKRRDAGLGFILKFRLWMRAKRRSPCAV